MLIVVLAFFIVFTLCVAFTRSLVALCISRILMREMSSAVSARPSKVRRLGVCDFTCFLRPYFNTDAKKKERHYGKVLLAHVGI